MGGGSGRILVIDDDHDVLTALRLLLKRHYPVIRTESDPAQIPGLLEDRAYDAVLLDMNYAIGAASGEEGLHWLDRILATAPGTPVILITAYGDVEIAVEAMRRGAADFVVKPWENEKLLAAVSGALERSDTGPAPLQAHPTKPDPTKSDPAPVSPPPAAKSRAVAERTRGAMIGTSPAMDRVWELIERAAPTQANVLILGENGTGKELVAREIHARSHLKDAPFVPVDLGEVPETLFESELFGHRKGAFTGAKEDRTGRFQAANGGTLFLDEIANVPLHLQAKLLSVIERREVRPVGADSAIPMTVRLLSATNASSAELHDEARFRQDLLYRINTVEIRLPALRERREDIPLLADHFRKAFAHSYKRPTEGLSPRAINHLMAHDWPGNVRELRHAVERAVILNEGVRLEPEDFPFERRDGQAPGPRSPLASMPDPEITVRLDAMERTAVQQALKKNGGNVSRTARDLGLTRASLYRRMEKYGL